MQSKASALIFSVSVKLLKSKVAMGYQQFKNWSFPITDSK